jgi:hypothetical protein
MADIFVSQGNITITLDTNVDLSTATSPLIMYRKPDGTKGVWSATITGQNLSYNLTDSDIDVAGRWAFQAFVLIAGESVFGSFAYYDFKQPLYTYLTIPN